MLIVAVRPPVLQDGRTPLYVAASYGHFEVAKLLLDRNADISKANKVGSPFRFGGKRCSGVR